MPAKFLIIDGYNVLHGVGLLATPVGPGGLEKARNFFLGVCAQHLSLEQKSRTTIVFDSDASGPVDSAVVSGMLVEFATEHSTADARIIELVKRHSAPKQLTVISSDHEIQRVAAARKARFLDGDVWYDALTESAPYSVAEAPVDSREQARVNVGTELWLQEFGLDEVGMEGLLNEPPNSTGRTGPPAKSAHRANGPESRPESRPESQQPSPPETSDSPFPSDILEEADELFGDNDADK